MSHRYVKAPTVPGPGREIVLFYVMYGTKSGAYDAKRDD
jgi:hypothetical protein